jgi:hypothetical protein
MARSLKTFAVLLALLLCASGGVTSLAACPHNARAAVASAHALHDCCRARLAHADAHSHATHNHAAHSRDAITNDAARVESSGDTGSTCTYCCSSNGARASTPAIAPAQKSKRAAEALTPCTGQFSSLSDPYRLALTPTQHAPPRAAARLHILISVILI